MCKVSKVRNHLISILDNCSVFFFSSFMPMSYTVVMKLVVQNRHPVEKGSLQRYILCRKVFQVDRVVLLLSHIRSKAAKELNNCFT